MQIGELFETRVADKIEPVIKVSENTDEQKLASEISSYVVTPTIEKYLTGFLDHYTDTFQTETTEIGVWISGYFGSGKSHLAKIMGLLAENRKLAGATACQRFEARLPRDTTEANAIRRAIARMDQCDTQVLAFNVNTLADSKATPLPKLLLSQFYQSKGYGSNVLYARVIEAELDRQGRLAELHATVEASARRSWAEIQRNPGFYQRQLYAAASQLAPEAFPTPGSVDDALKRAQAGELHNIGFLVDTLLADLKAREQVRRRKQRLMLVLDESGQWIEGDKDRLAQLQALIEEAASRGQGRIWIVVTTHGDMGSVLKEARALEGDMKKIEGRFRYKFALTTENIELVLEDRLFKKKLQGRQELDAIYKRRGGVLRDMGEMPSPIDRTLPVCTADKFATYYPFFPYQVSLIPEIVKSLRSRGGRGEQLSGSTRTLLAIVQDILRAGRRSYLDQEVGLLVSFDEVYFNLAGEGEVSPDVRDDLGRITRNVKDAVPLTQQVAEVLYLVRELPFILRSKQNIARMLARDVDDDLAALVARVEPELDRLRRARLVGLVGDEYEFLTGEKRTFEEEVATREGELRVQDRERGLAEHFFYQTGRSWWSDWVGFQTIPDQGAGSPFKLVLDTFSVPGRQGDVTLHIATPFGHETLQSIEDKSLRAEEQNTVFLFSPAVARCEEHLNRYLAMRELVDIWKGDPHRSEDARRLGQEKEREDLPKVRQKVLDDLREGLSHAQIVFRGSSRQVSVPASKKLSEVLRAEVASFWPVIYPKLERLPLRMADEEGAIRDVLAGGTSHRDVRALKLFDKGGKLDPAAVVVDAIRVYLAGQQARSRRVLGADLLTEFSAPPYGWDGNALRIGLAALVRAGVVKIVVNKKSLTNPTDPELVDAIRVTRNFDKAEIVLEETEIDPDELAAVRTILRRLTKKRDIDETPAALAEVAGQVAADVASRADRIRVWAAPAGFPLHADFDAAVDAWVRVASLTNPTHRVHEVYVGADRLEQGYAFVHAIALFHANEGTKFVEMRRLVSDLLAVEHRVDEGNPVRAFLSAFEHARENRSLADLETWRHLRSLEASARLEVSVLLERWRALAREHVQAALKAAPREADDLRIPLEVRTQLEAPLQAFLRELEETAGTVRIATLAEVARQHTEKLRASLLREGANRAQLDPLLPVVPPPGEEASSGAEPAGLISWTEARRVPDGALHFSTVRVDAFRSLRGLVFERLARVNLFVCRNNGGKTSLLEAVAAACLPLNAKAWVDVVRHRAPTGSERSRREQFLWLFPRNAETARGADVKLSFDRPDGARWDVTASLTRSLTSPIDAPTEVELSLRRTDTPTADARTTSFSLMQAATDLPAERTKVDVPNLFISPVTHRSELFQILAFKELDDADTRERVLRLLRQLAPDLLDLTVDRTGPQPSISVTHKRWGEAPISTFGDGIRRSLALALAMIRCRDGGVLLIDEIESGVHFSALRHVYEWLVAAADKYNVQLFITTHSLEAIDALLEATPEKPDIVFFRLYDLGKGKGVEVLRMSEAELRTMREDYGDEVRG